MQYYTLIYMHENDNTDLLLLENINGEKNNPKIY